MQESVKIEGLDETVAFLQDLEKKIENSKKLYAEAANVVVNAVEHSFETESDYDGVPWLPLKPETIKRKGFSKMLWGKKGGTLQESLYSHSSDTGAEIGISATANRYYYPMVHQFGSKDKTIPARTFFPVDNNMHALEGLKKEIMEAISDGLDALIK